MGRIIEGVFIERLKIISDKRGRVMHMLRNDSELYTRFGEIYFSFINPGFIKGWKKHLIANQHYAVPIGNIKLVLYDDRQGSGTYGLLQEIYTGQDNYSLIRIPAGIWYSFSSQGKAGALIANCTDIAHDASESMQSDLNNNRIPYKWSS